MLDNFWKVWDIFNLYSGNELERRRTIRVGSARSLFSLKYSAPSDKRNSALIIQSYASWKSLYNKIASAVCIETTYDIWPDNSNNYSACMIYNSITYCSQGLNWGWTGRAGGTLHNLFFGPKRCSGTCKERPFRRRIERVPRLRHSLKQTG